MPPAPRDPPGSHPPANFRRWPFWRRWLGRRSERFAARYLRCKGYRVVAANVADALGELDLLAVQWTPQGRTLVVVEVRSTSTDDPDRAAASVDFVKQQRITAATLRFLARRGLLDHPVRYDVVALAWPDPARPPVVVQYENAFSPAGRFQFYS